ncbi:MAG TPA: carbohydrate-binding domain-containing protein [Myxococcota bacterium]
MSRISTLIAISAVCVAPIVPIATGCTFGPGLKGGKQAPSPTHSKPVGSEGEGEGSTGVVLDCPAPSAGASATPPTLQQMADRYSSDIDPLMRRTSGGCLQCHATDSGRLMTMVDSPQDTFFRVRAGGFFRLVTGMVPERIIDETMPQGGPMWSDSEKDTLLSFACDLATIDDAGVPPDEVFPPDLLSPYTGAAPTDYDDTFLTYEQLRGRIIQQFDDDWVREGVDEFSLNIALFGGADFVNTFVPARDAEPEFFDGLTTLSEDVCLRAATNATGPFDSLDLDAATQDEAASQLQAFEAEHATFVGLPAGCEPGANATTVTLCTTSSASEDITLPSGGDYTFTAKANGQACGPDLPHMEIQIDGTAVGSFDVPATGLQTFTVPATHVDAGGHTLSVAFTNDFSQSGCDRNLVVDNFSIQGPIAGSTGGAAGAVDATKARLATVFSKMLLRAPSVTAANDEIQPLYDMLVSVENETGDRRGAYSAVCEGLMEHPDFLFTRPAAFDDATGGERERLLVIKTAFDLVNRPPNDTELTQFNAGQIDRAGLIDQWLASDEFINAYQTRVRAILEYDGTPDGEEPSRLWTYVMKNDRPLKEILTADYTVDENGNKIARDPVHGATGLLTMKGFIKGKPGLPHYNYSARVFTGFLGFVFNVPQAALDARATATAASTVDTTSICFSCHRLLTPLAYQRQKWDDDGNYRETINDEPIDDSDNNLVADYPYKGPGIESFSLVAVRKEGFIRRMANVHFTFSFGRNMRHDQDERDVYLTLWNAANSGNGTFRDIMKQVLLSRSYTNPPKPTTGGAP